MAQAKAHATNPGNHVVIPNHLRGIIIIREGGSRRSPYKLFLEMEDGRRAIEASYNSRASLSAGCGIPGPVAESIVQSVRHLRG